MPYTLSDTVCHIPYTMYRATLPALIALGAHVEVFFSSLLLSA